MRQVFVTDVTAAARALLAAEEGDRETLCARMLAEAEIADVYLRRHARLHPRFGNGTLKATASRRQMAPEPSLDSASYLRCFSMVLAHLAQRQKSAFM